MERRLAAVLVADIVGYSRLMNEDEEGTLRALKDTFKSLIEPKVTQYHGRIFKLTGDGALMEFASAVDATAFAVEVQCAMRDRNQDVPEERQITYRTSIDQARPAHGPFEACYINFRINSLLLTSFPDPSISATPKNTTSAPR